MPRKLKAAHGSSYFSHKEHSGCWDVIVIAPTKKRTVELINEHCGVVSMNEFNNYWSQNSGTTKALELLENGEEGVWAKPYNSKEEWEKIPTSEERRNDKS